MSVYDIPRRSAHDSENTLAILETVLRNDSVRLSALLEALSLDDADTRDVLTELRADDLVSTYRLDDEDDLIVTSLPRLRDYERTKIHRLVYN